MRSLARNPRRFPGRKSGRAVRRIPHGPRALAAIALGLLTAALLACAARPPAARPFRDRLYRVRVTRDVIYGRGAVRGGDSMPLALDLYEPAGAAPRPRPALLAIHGGGFTSGDKANPADKMGPWCEDLASRGWACASMNYRLEGDDPAAEGDTPHARAARAAIEDAARALGWLAASAARLGVDSTELAIGGNSAGGVAALVTAYPDPLGAPRVRAVVDLWGSLGRGVSSLRRGGPAVIVVHGTADPLVPFRNAEAIVERARAVGVPSELHAIHGAGHGIDLTTRDRGLTLYDQIADFLYTHVVRPTAER